MTPRYFLTKSEPGQGGLLAVLPRILEQNRVATKANPDTRQDMTRGRMFRRVYILRPLLYLRPPTRVDAVGRRSDIDPDDAIV